MVTEKQLDLIDRQALGIGRCNPDVFPIENRGYCAGWNGVISLIEQAPTVNAIPVEQYIELREQYDRVFTAFHELRDDFISYVCGGIPNPSPFCKNRCAGCVDKWGWCRQTEACKGFNPAEVFLDGGGTDGT